VLILNKNTNKIMEGPEIITRGFIYAKEADDMIREAIDTLKSKLKDSDTLAERDWGAVKTLIRDTASKYFYNKTKRSPMILPVIMEV